MGKTKKKKWIMGAEIIGGECAVYVEAETRAEAVEKMRAGDWQVMDGTENWECEVCEEDIEAEIEEVP